MGAGPAAAPSLPPRRRHFESGATRQRDGAARADNMGGGGGGGGLSGAARPALLGKATRGPGLEASAGRLPARSTALTRF